MLQPLISVEKYLVTPHNGGNVPTVWGCMDPRPPHEADPVIGAGAPYYQLPGGAQGAAESLALAMEMGNPGGFSKLNQPTHAFAKIINRLVAGAVIFHADCKKIANTPDIGQKIATPSEETFAAVQEIGGGRVDEQRYERAAWAGRQFLERGLFVAASQTEADLSRATDQFPSLHCAHLKDRGQIPRGFVSIWAPDTAFDVRTADADGNSHFAITPGSFVKSIARPFSESTNTPLNEEDVVAALTVVAAGTYNAVNVNGDLPITRVEQVA